MLDFSSALYLGMRHPAHGLRPWKTLTYGAPAALREPEGACVIAQKLAALQGCERAVLAPSTLHLFWDLFGILSRDNIAIYMDAGVYPIGRWGVERAASRGVPVRTVRHYCSDALSMAIKNDSSHGKRPVILADGFCPACGKAAPVSEYANLASSTGGLLILDDTQSLGLYGHSPDRNNPYGTGGGGILQWNDITKNPYVLTASSTAKGFGVPLAALSGSSRMVGWFEEKSETRVHCSPPSLAVISSLEHALAMNEKYGRAIRSRLAQLVRYLLDQLQKVGLRATGGLFPMQTLLPRPGLNPAVLHVKLLAQGIRTVLHHARNGHGCRISFIVTARHRPEEIDHAADALAVALRTMKFETTRPEVLHETQLP